MKNSMRKIHKFRSSTKTSLKLGSNKQQNPYSQIPKESKEKFN
jgi:hypothetical protein